MSQNVAAFSEPGLDVYFLSARAHIDGKPTQHLVQFIQSAKKSLDCAIYDLKHPEIVHALQGVADKITLRIAYDGGKEKEVKGGPSLDPKPNGTAQIIEKSGLSKYATAIHVTGGHLMHSKYAIRDDDTVWTGSGNWTYGGLDLQDNNFLLFSSQPLANAYKTNFETLISKLHKHPAKTEKPDTAQLFLPERAITTGNLTVTPYFSGGGTKEIENVVVTLINNASKVRIMAMLISDPGILQALSKFKPAGKDIKGVLDPHEMKQVMNPPHGKAKVHPSLFWFVRNDKRFVAAPSHAYSQIDNNDFMHNKVMIIDDRTVITGSYNFSVNAESNDENMLILESREVAAAYTTYFDFLFSHYQTHGVSLVSHVDLTALRKGFNVSFKSPANSERSLKEASERVETIYARLTRQESVENKPEVLRFITSEDFKDIIKVNNQTKEINISLAEREYIEMSNFILDRMREAIQHNIIDQEGKDAFEKDIKGWKNYLGPELFEKAKKTWI